MAKRRHVKGRKVRKKVTSWYGKKGHRARKGGRYVAGAVVWKIRKAKAARRHGRKASFKM